MHGSDDPAAARPRVEQQPTVDIDAVIARRLQPPCLEIDIELIRAAQGSQDNASCDRHDLVAEVVGRKVWLRVDLERSVHQELGQDVPLSRWDRVLEDALEICEESMAVYLRGLDLMMVLGRAEPRLRSIAEDLQHKADGLRSHLRASAEWQIDIARREARLRADAGGSTNASGRRRMLRVGLASVRNVATRALRALAG